MQNRNGDQVSAQISVAGKVDFFRRQLPQRYPVLLEERRRNGGNA